MIVRMKNTFRMLLAAMLLSLFALPGYSWQKSFPQKDYVAYFTGNSGDEEAVRYAVSMDGYTYWALNDNEPVIDSKVISSTGGVRDPHIFRCEDGKTSIQNPIQNFALAPNNLTDAPQICLDL